MLASQGPCTQKNKLKDHLRIPEIEGNQIKTKKGFVSNGLRSKDLLELSRDLALVSTSLGSNTIRNPLVAVAAETLCPLSDPESWVLKETSIRKKDGNQQQCLFGACARGSQWLPNLSDQPQNVDHRSSFTRHLPNTENNNWEVPETSTRPVSSRPTGPPTPRDQITWDRGNHTKSDRHPCSSGSSEIPSLCAWSRSRTHGTSRERETTASRQPLKRHKKSECRTRAGVHQN